MRGDESNPADRSEKQHNGRDALEPDNLFPAAAAELPAGSTTEDGVNVFWLLFVVKYEKWSEDESGCGWM